MSQIAIGTIMLFASLAILMVLRFPIAYSLGISAHYGDVHEHPLSEPVSENDHGSIQLYVYRRAVLHHDGAGDV